MEKRGLSEVVTNVLIILLVIVAIGIIWAFIQPMITKSGQQIQAGQECLTLSTALEIAKCNATGTSVDVLVKRGSGEANLKELKIILEKGDDSTEALTQTQVPGELETKLYSLVASANPKKVGVAAGIADDKGNVNYCAETARIACA